MSIRLNSALLALLAVAAPARAETVADFYRGKTVQFVLGYGPGGGYDVYARLVTRFIGKYIPGQPNVVLVNMPGAGSLRGTNYLYNTAPRDGSVIGAFARDMPLMGIMGGNPAVQFDPRKFTWLGSSSSSLNDAYVLFVRKDAVTHSIEDALRPGGAPIVLSGTGEGATGNDVAVLLRDALGLNLKIINGYPDSGAMFLAIDRKEVDGRFVGLSAVRSSKPEWLKPDTSMNALLQFARATRHPRFPDAPTALELAKTDRARALIELASLPWTLSRPVAAPPGVPEDRAKALRDAFMAMQGDSEYVAESERLGLDVSPISGEQEDALLDRISKAPPELFDTLRRLQAANKGGG